MRRGPAEYGEGSARPAGHNVPGTSGNPAPSLGPSRRGRAKAPAPPRRGPAPAESWPRSGDPPVGRRVPPPTAARPAPRRPSLNDPRALNTGAAPGTRGDQGLKRPGRAELPARKEQGHPAPRGDRPEPAKSLRTPGRGSATAAAGWAGLEGRGRALIGRLRGAGLERTAREERGRLRVRRRPVPDPSLPFLRAGRARRRACRRP